MQPYVKLTVFAWDCANQRYTPIYNQRFSSDSEAEEFSHCFTGAIMASIDGRQLQASREEMQTQVNQAA